MEEKKDLKVINDGQAVTLRDVMKKNYGDDTMKELEAFVPAGQPSKMLYIASVVEDVLGRDKTGKLRSAKDLIRVMMYAKSTGLDPVKRQFYAVYRKDWKTQKEEMALQTGIDGLRAIAEKTGLYAGSDDPVYDGEDIEKIDFKDKQSGKVYKTITVGHPIKAIVTVKKINKMTGEAIDIKASVLWNEFYPGPQFTMWHNKPFFMLGKCAEALALRKAFPQKLGGLYIQEEFQKEDAGQLLVLPPVKIDDKVKARKSKAKKEANGALAEQVKKEATDGKKDSK